MMLYTYNIMRGKHSLLYIHQLVHKRSERGHLYKGTQIDTEQGQGGGSILYRSGAG